MSTYIAGLVAADGTLTPDQVAENVALFDRAENRLRDAGQQPINPTKLLQSRPHELDEITPGVNQAAMRTCLLALLGSDTLYLLRNWKQSVGAQLERKIAIAIGMSISGECSRCDQNDALPFTDCRVCGWILLCDRCASAHREEIRHGKYRR